MSVEVCPLRWVVSPLCIVPLLSLLLCTANAQERGTADAIMPLPTLNAARRARVIDSAVSALTAGYVFPDVAKKMADFVHLHQQQGDFDSVADGYDLAKKLTADFQEVSHDKHIMVGFVPQRPPDASEPTREQMKKQLESVNCGFNKVERLESNIGYLKFDFFADPSLCRATAVAAMAFLSNVDALIVDLRDNGGGDPHMIAFLSSYLFAKPPGDIQWIDENFGIFVPTGRAINPRTKTNWEGVGVEPDVAVPAADALPTAQGLAAKMQVRQ